MELSVDLEGFPIAQVIQIIARGKHSGLAAIGRGGTRVKIVFDSGRITYASSTSLNHIGSVLVKKGTVSKEDIDRALAVQSRTHPHRPIATILAEMGLVDQEVLAGETLNHIRAVLNEVLAWKEGKFVFKEVRVDHDLLILKSGVPTESLLSDPAPAAPAAQCPERNSDLDGELRCFLP